MLDKDFEIQMEQIQEMTFEEIIDLRAFLSAWDRVELLGIRFDPYPMMERDCNGDELTQWMWN